MSAAELEKIPSVEEKDSRDKTTKGGPVRITRIRMVGFRSFEDYTLDIPSGLVFICGPNESGKTSIMRAVLMGLFVDAATGRQDIHRYRRWGSDGGFRIELTLENENGKWEIIRDFDTRRNLLKKPDGTTERDKQRISETIASLLGLPKENGEAAYVASACILQDQLSSGAEDLKKLIENRVVGEGVDVLQLARDADKRIKELRAGSKGGSQGELTRASNRVRELEKKLSEVQSNVARARAARLKVSELTHQIEVLERDVQALTLALEKARKYAQAQAIYQEQSAELQKVFSLREQRKDLERRLSELTPNIQELSETKKKLEEEKARKGRLEDIERQITMLRGERTRLSDLRHKADNLLREAAVAEERLEALTQIDPEKVEKAVELDRSRVRLEQELCEARNAADRWSGERAALIQEREKKAEQESHLSKLLSVRKQLSLLDSACDQVRKLEVAIGRYKESKNRLASVVPVLEEDLEKARRLSAAISAMGGVPAGLAVEINKAAEIEAQTSIDGASPKSLEPGATKFSALKSVAISVPRLLEIHVGTTDAEEFFEKMRRTREELDVILKRYGVETVEDLAKAFDEYRNAESAVSSAREQLETLLAAITSSQAGGTASSVSAYVAGTVKSAGPMEDTGESTAGDLTTGADLGKIAEDVAAALREQTGELEKLILSALSDLGMTVDGLRPQQVAQIESEIGNIRSWLRSADVSIAKLNGLIEGLKLEEKVAELERIKSSIAALLAETGCSSLKEMLEKNEQLASLRDLVRDRKSRAVDLLDGKTIEELDREIAEVDGKLQSLEEEKNNILAQEPLSPDLEEKLYSVEQKLKQMESERDTISGKISAIDPGELDRKEQQILAKLKPAEHDMEDTALYKMVPEEIAKRELVLGEKKALLQELRDERTKAQATVEIISEGAEDVAEVSEELEDAKRVLAHLEREVRILEILRDVLPEARTRAIAGAVSFLSRASSKYLSDITLGKYDSMEISEDLDAQVYSKARGDVVSVRSERDLLSAGTNDQVLLAARLAIADLLSQGKRPPIIMDDPFVHFDPERRRGAIDVLKQVAKDYQVIVLTCHDYPEIAGQQKVVLR